MLMLTLCGRRLWLRSWVVVLGWSVGLLVGCRPTAGSAESASLRSAASGTGAAAAAAPSPGVPGATAGSALGASFRPLLDSSLCLDVAGDLLTRGEAVVLSSCAPVASQDWVLDHNSLRTQDRCLDVSGISAQPGAQLNISDCTEGNATQLWSYAAKHLQLGQTGLCLAMPADKPQAGQTLQLATCVQNADAQMYTMGSYLTAPDPNSSARRIDIVNACAQSIWVNNGTSSFAMPQNTNLTSYLPYGWSGRIWGRTDCTLVGTQGTCADDIPLTLAEFTFDGWGGGNGATLDYYDISLVDGFNITMKIAPQGGAGNCHAPACNANILAACAPGLVQTSSAGQVIACVSGCTRYRTDADCCQNANAARDACPQPPTAVAFKQACPDAYSYPYDDATSTFACAHPTGYTVTFCPP